MVKMTGWHLPRTMGSSIAKNTRESTPKLIFEVTEGKHRVANSPLGGNGEVGRLAISWLKVFLEGDNRYRRFLLQEPKSASLFKSNLE
ncbi:MAG: hypothetical protein NZ961_06535 [Candidatus Poribacteria bacterium]|nr:hypothetical protein [Candidatus Poribacteria bacterium]